MPDVTCARTFTSICTVWWCRDGERGCVTLILLLLLLLCQSGTPVLKKLLRVELTVRLCGNEMN